MPNRLAQETSPYLQQHADNPVDWYAWGDEALKIAREQDRPILLSIGYSACHWCHVMASESFEDQAVAELMNRHFVNIKVDREERPDLDQIYQLAHQMISQRSGGWPLTMFLTPGQEPFFGGTYFPPTARYGLPGFSDLLGRVAQFYASNKAEIAKQNESIQGAFERMQPASPAHHSEFSAAPLHLALENLRASFDSTCGGFGQAPKFPHPTDLELCLRRHAATGDAQALKMAAYTLGRMAMGGIYDQLGGGFCRYSTDATWLIPHFEKMTYDNGPLLGLCADAFAVTRDPLFAAVAVETAGWVMREMQSPEGGYYSSLDADSEHVEGKFYVWSREEVQAALSVDEYAVCAAFYGVDGPPNFEHKHWNLHVARALEDIATDLGMSAEQCGALLGQARAKLLAVRERRIRPGRDEKILGSWNALMIGGMARAARIFDRPDWLASARRALEFIRTTLWKDGRLLATSKDGRAHLNAYLDDYAFLIAALVELAQADFRSEDLEFAGELAEVLLEQFQDAKQGGFFFTSHDHERLIHRGKPGHDNATPSGNGVAAFALQRLGHVTGETRYLEAAERTLQLFYPALARQPGGYSSLLMALEEALEPPRVVVLRGPAAQLRDWQDKLRGHYFGATLTLAVPDDAAGLPPVLAKPVSPGAVNAYVCRGVTCLPPVDSVAALLGILKPAENR